MEVTCHSEGVSGCVGFGVTGLPAVVGPPVAGGGDELQHEGNAGELEEHLDGVPVEVGRGTLHQVLHHLHHLLPAGRTCLKNKRTPTKVNFPLTIFPLEQSDNDSGSMLCNYLLSMFCLYQRYVM